MLSKTNSLCKHLFLYFPSLKLQLTQCRHYWHTSFRINTHSKIYKQTIHLNFPLYQHFVSSSAEHYCAVAYRSLSYSIRSSSTMAPTAQFIRPSATSPTLRGTRPITVCVEGNIGSGKTTLLNNLAAREGVEVFQEPVSKWRNVRGKNLLDLMYQDPSRWSHLFQTYVQLTMLQLHMKPSNANVKVLERSIHSARHCFVENLYQTGKMTQPEYNVYCEWYNTITANLDVSVDLIEKGRPAVLASPASVAPHWAAVLLEAAKVRNKVYLSAEPEVVQERIIQRGRTEEASIPLSYLSQLHGLHQTWLKKDALPAPLLVLHKDMTIQQMCISIEEHLGIILCERQSPASSGGAGSSVGGPSSLFSPLTARTLSPTPLPETAAATN